MVALQAIDLPVREALPALRRALSERRSALLCAPPGSGKTTLVPLALLDEPWLQGGTILMLEPRRLAARAAAARMASLRGQRVGEGVGYRVRMDSQVSAATRIEVLTEGILTRRLQRDPELGGVGLVIFDEFHERNLHGDLALALSIEVQQGLRNDLRLLVMSATLDAEPLAALLGDQQGDAPIVTAQGRSYPVGQHYLRQDPPRRELITATATVVRQALSEQSGDLLVFLPGAGEIRRLAAELDAGLGDAVVARPLFGALSQADQDLALRPDLQGRRRVVLATDIAESSLTIDGVSVVVDAGLARRPRFDPNSGLTRLLTRRCSRASATQRAGRAGRLGPGYCYRLWSETSQRGLIAHDPAEILDADLSALLLELAVWGTADPGELAWLDPPPVGALAQARELLQSLGALDQQGRATRRGKAMAELPLEPRLAHMLIEADAAGGAQSACRLAALLSERDILRSGSGSGRADNHHGADLDRRLQLLDRVAASESRQRGRGHNPGQSASPGLDRRACQQVLRVARQWQRLLDRQHLPDARQGSSPATVSVGVMLSWAWPDRIARRRSAGSSCYRLANGCAACVRDDDPLVAHEWLVIAQLDAARADGRVYLAAALTLADLQYYHAAAIQARQVIAWDAGEQAVQTRHETRFGALRLASCPADQADPQRVADAMLDGIRRMGLNALPWNDAARRLQTRLLNVRQWQQAGSVNAPPSVVDWPDVSDATLLATLDDWLGPYLDGIRRRAHLARLDLHAILKAQLDWSRQQRLDQLLPSHYQVPSGSRIALEYRIDAPPVLAVRLQEMFGQAETPTVCDNSVAVLVHLLSPAHRPIQVTTDLAGFWQHTYHEVRKELKGRYPKHYWPEDPLTAVATARARPRR